MAQSCTDDLYSSPPETTKLFRDRRARQSLIDRDTEFFRLKFGILGCYMHNFGDFVGIQLASEHFPGILELHNV